MEGKITKCKNNLIKISRPVVIKTGVLNNCNGSSLIEDENNTIYTGLKLEIGDVNPNYPNRGIV